MTQRIGSTMFCRNYLLAEERRLYRLSPPAYREGQRNAIFHLAKGGFIHGSFNICLPVSIENWRRRPGRRVLIRFPLPFKVGDSNSPGNAQKKDPAEARFLLRFLLLHDDTPEVPHERNRKNAAVGCLSMLVAFLKHAGNAALQISGEGSNVHQIPVA